MPRPATTTTLTYFLPGYAESWVLTNDTVLPMDTRLALRFAVKEWTTGWERVEAFILDAQSNVGAFNHWYQRLQEELYQQARYRMEAPDPTLAPPVPWPPGGLWEYLLARPTAVCAFAQALNVGGWEWAWLREEWLASMTETVPNHTRARALSYCLPVDATTYGSLYASETPARWVANRDFRVRILLGLGVRCTVPAAFWNDPQAFEGVARAITAFTGAKDVVLATQRLREDVKRRGGRAGCVVVVSKADTVDSADSKVDSVDSADSADWDDKFTICAEKSELEASLEAVMLPGLFPSGDVLVDKGPGVLDWRPVADRWGVNEGMVSSATQDDPDSSESSDPLSPAEGPSAVTASPSSLSLAPPSSEAPVSSAVPFSSASPSSSAHSTHESSSSSPRESRSLSDASRPTSPTILLPLSSPPSPSPSRSRSSPPHPAPPGYRRLFGALAPPHYDDLNPWAWNHGPFPEDLAAVAIRAHVKYQHEWNALVRVHDVHRVARERQQGAAPAASATEPSAPAPSSPASSAPAPSAPAPSVPGPSEPETWDDFFSRCDDFFSRVLKRIVALLWGVYLFLIH